MGLFDNIDLNPFDGDGLSLGSVGRAASSVGRTVGRELYRATPLDNVVGITQGLRQGDWGKVGRNIAGGAFDVAMFAIPASMAFKGARLAGAGVGGGAFRGLARGLVSDPTTMLLERGLSRVAPRLAANPLMRGSIFLAGAALPGSAAERAVWNTIGNVMGGGSPAAATPTGPLGTTARPTTASNRPMGTPDMLERRAQAAATAAATPAAGAAAATPAGGTTATNKPAAVPAGGLVANDPAVQAALDAERIAAEEELQNYVNQLALARVRGSAAEEAALREAARASAGGAVDVAGMFGESGLGYSPATLMSALEQLRGQEAAARRGILGERTGRISEAGRMEESARRAYERALQGIRAREVAGRTGQTISMIQPYLGGAQ